jgi:hypothetical protein
MSDTSEITGLGLGEEKRYDTMKEVLFDTKDLELKTDLREIETGLHSTVVWSNDWIKNDWGVDLHLDELIRLKEKRLISKNRLSRGEATAILKEAEITPEKTQNTLKRMLGIP